MEKSNRFAIICAGVSVTLLATLANLLFFLFTKILGEQYLIPLTESSIETGPLPYRMVILATIISSSLATLLYYFLNKISPKSFLPPFLSISITAFLISLGGPIDVPGVEFKTKILLIGMHIIAGIIIIGGLLFFPGRFKRTSQKKKIKKENPTNSGDLL